MSPRTYYRAALLLPLVVPLLALAGAQQTILGGILILSLMFGGPAYVLFAVAMFFWVGRLPSVSSIQKVTWLMPLLFLPVQALGWIGYVYYQAWTNPGVSTTDSMSVLAPFAVFVLGFGYVYVAIANLGYKLLLARGLIRPSQSGTFRKAIDGVGDK